MGPETVDKLAEETGIPNGFHLAVIVRRTRLDSDGNGNPWVAAATRVAAQPQGFQLIDPITGLIWTGMLDRHPNLKLVMAEAGIGWVPFMVQSLDNHAKRLKEGRRLIGKDGEQANLPALAPSEYFHRNIWITFEDDAAGMSMVGRLLDTDKIMWASDYPHADSYTDAPGLIKKLGLPEDVRKKLMNTGAKRFYKLG